MVFHFHGHLRRGRLAVEIGGGNLIVRRRTGTDAGGTSHSHLELRIALRLVDGRDAFLLLLRQASQLLIRLDAVVVRLLDAALGKSERLLVVSVIEAIPDSGGSGAQRQQHSGGGKPARLPSREARAESGGP